MATRPTGVSLGSLVWCVKFMMFWSKTVQNLLLLTLFHRRGHVTFCVFLFMLLCGCLACRMAVSLGWSPERLFSASGSYPNGVIQPWYAMRQAYSTALIVIFASHMFRSTV